MNRSLEQIEEALCVAKAQSGDSQAFRRLVEAYDQRLWYFARRMLDDDDRIADVLQEVWLSVFRSLHRLSSPAAFRVWLYRIAHDRVVSELRRIGREIVIEPLGNYDPTGNECESDLLNSETVESVHRGLNQLSVDHRRVLTLLYLEEMSVAEIGEVLGCNVGTVKSRLHYARAALACWLKDQDA